MGRFILFTFMGLTLMCALSGCASLGSRGQGEDASFVPSLPEVPTQTLPSTARVQSGGLSPQEEEALRQQVVSLQAQLTQMKPGVDRLLSIENDIRILLEQLAAISDTSLAQSHLASSAPGGNPVRPLGASPAQQPSSFQPLASGDESGGATQTQANTTLQPLSQNAPRTDFAPTQSAGGPANLSSPPPLTPPAQTLLREEQARAAQQSAQASPSTSPSPMPATASPTPRPTPPPVSSPTVNNRDVVRGQDEIFVHLASYRSEEMAQAGWREMVAQYGSILAGLYPRIIRADLGERGIYYRLHAGHFLDQASAQALCERLKSVDVYCQVTHLAPSGA
ncbi:SPOR domain-containing protein [Woodsholea maritima]|uniref:SPOR domain-containing protein n=1 Tax=Woodsholea maritima TaxID=240237 RepID=UPI0003776EB3|nr:SPOR domain-containing protein [Woodsholea maritima]